MKYPEQERSELFVYVFERSIKKLMNNRLVMYSYYIFFFIKLKLIL